MTINYQMFEKRFKFILLCILFVVFVIAISKPIEFFRDSDGYLNMDIYRSAGYPIFLRVLKMVSGSQFAWITTFVQSSIGLVAIYIFVTRLKRLLSLNPLFYLLLAIILAVPYIHIQNLANVYLSEALTYPLYLLVTIYFLECFLTNNVKNLWMSLPILFILILTRSQFLFFIPVGILMIIWFSVKDKSLKKYLLISGALIILPILTSLADKFYHQLKHDAFVNTPWTGIHLITPAFYVADEEDFKVYESKDEQQFFKWIFAKLYHRNLNINNLNEEGTYDPTAYYSVHFSEIANETIYDSGKELVGTNLSENEKFIALDQLTKKMTLPLVMDNFGSWLKLYIKNAINAFGSSKYALLYFLLLIFGIVALIKKGNDTFKVITLISVLTFANVALVAIGMHTIKRFTFYNDWVLFLIVFILLDGFIKYKKPLS